MQKTTSRRRRPKALCHFLLPRRQRSRDFRKMNTSTRTFTTRTVDDLRAKATLSDLKGLELVCKAAKPPGVNRGLNVIDLPIVFTKCCIGGFDGRPRACPGIDCRARAHGNVTKSQSEPESRPERKRVKSDVNNFKRSTSGEVLYPDDVVVSKVVISTNAKVKPDCMVATL